LNEEKQEMTEQSQLGEGYRAEAIWLRRKVGFNLPTAEFPRAAQSDIAEKCPDISPITNITPRV
jgi:hypothetical protein